MASNIQQRYEKYSTEFVKEFEMYIEVQRVIMEGDTTNNTKLTGIATESIKELFKSPAGMVGKALSGVKDYVLQQRKLDIAGKIVNLVNKYQNPEEKKVIRAMLVRVAYDIFRSFEHQFMIAEKSEGGWSQAMVQLARTAVWCFMHYYKFHKQEELDEKYVLEGITLKNMPDIRIWKKWYYRDEKKFSKVTNTEDNVKCDGVKIYSKVGLILSENGKDVYYKNDLTKPEKYGYRRIFSHEQNEDIKKEYNEIKSESVVYEYQLNMETATKERMCENMMEIINRTDDSLLEERLSKNMARITENIMENLMCEMMQQMVDTLNGISVPASTSTSTVNNESTTNSHFLCHTQTAEKIQNLNQATFNEKVDISF